MSPFPILRSLLRVDGPASIEAALLRGSDADAVLFDPTRPRDEQPVSIAPHPAPAEPVAPRRLAVLRTDDPDLDAALDAAVGGRPAAVVLADCRSGACLQRLGAKLAVREAELGLADGSTPVIALIASPAGLLNLSSLAQASDRLVGLGWDAGQLAAGLGSTSGTRDAPLASARSMVLIAARAAGVQPFDDEPQPSSATTFRGYCRASRRMGFSGMMTRDAGRVAAINAVFGADAVGPEPK